MTYIPAADLALEAKKISEELDARTEKLKPKERMALPSQEMPSQPPEVRRNNFSEVALGYTADQARVEAERCLQCPKKPCIEGCPVKIDIPEFIKSIAEGDNGEAIAIIKQASLLPAICGRVCPQESQCQAPCTIGKVAKDVSQSVSIGRLERYVADLEREKGCCNSCVLMKQLAT